jgi:hypothetical protein
MKGKLCYNRKNKMALKPSRLFTLAGCLAAGALLGAKK